MSDSVKRTRRYESPVRREQAAITRRRILEAAQRLFERDGYTPTTMAAIAQEAAVSLKTVYLAFATKSGILRALWHLLLRGDEEPVPIGGLLNVIRDTAPAEPEIAELWARIQAEFYDNQRAVVADLHKRGALRRGLAVERAADILWTLNHPEVYRLMVAERGWAPDEHEQWLADLVCSQLLRPRAADTPRREANRTRRGSRSRI